MEKTTTIAIYVEDRDKLIDLCKKNESYRDKIHEILEKLYK